MDATRFDALTRAIAAGTTRRTLSRLFVILLALLALTAPGLASDAAAKKKNQRRKRPRAEGPCGNGGGKANRCKKNRQCCTGFCKKRKKKRKKNGRKRTVQGRCRCRKEGQSCTDDRNCCPQRTGRICVNGQCQLPCGAGGPCTVFVTSTTHQGDFGGLTAADVICDGLAQAAGLSGRFMAWLSDGTGSPATRFDKMSGPYRLVNGVTIADDWADLTDGTLANPIDVTEVNGGVGAAIRVFSDTNTSGACRSCASSENNCNQWTDPSETMGNYGVTSATNGDWTSRNNSVNCSGWIEGDITYEYRLYCFQQP